MKRWVKTLIVVGVALIVAVLMAGLFFLGPVVRTAVNTVGPSLLGVPVEIGTMSVRPLSGRVTLGGVRVGNPEGFRSPSLFELDGLRVRVQPTSVLGDTILVEEILVSGLRITYETTGRRSNLGALLEGLQSKQPPSPDNVGPKDSTAPAKKVVIRRIVLDDMRVKVAATLAGGRGLTLPLGRMELTDIGTRHQAVTATAAATQVIRAIATGVATALAGSAADLAAMGIDAVKAVGDLGAEGIAAAADLAAKGARVVGEGVSAGTAALGEGVSHVGRRIGGMLFGGEREAPNGDHAGEAKGVEAENPKSPDRN